MEVVLNLLWSWLWAAIKMQNDRRINGRKWKVQQMGARRPKLTTERRSLTAQSHVGSASSTLLCLCVCGFLLFFHFKFRSLCVARFTFAKFTDK